MISAIDIGLLLAISAVFLILLQKYWKGFSHFPITLPLVLWIWHLLFTAFYFWYTFHNSSDAWEYYHDPTFRGNADNWLGLYGSGISFIFFLIYPFSQFLGLSYVVVFYLFSLIGLWGIYYFIGICEAFFQIKAERSIGFLLFLIFLFWPSMHFWTAAVGKDGPAVFAIMLFFYSALLPTKRWLGLIVALVLLLHIRAHMAALCLGAFAGAYFIERFIQGNIKLREWAVLLGAIVLGIISLPWLLPKVDVFEVSFSAIAQSLSEMQHRFADTNHGLDLRKMSIPSRYFTFLFRPMPGDSQNMLGYGLMAQNIFILIVIIVSLYRSFQLRSFPRKAWSIMATLYFMVGTFIFSQALSNLGLIDREKAMFMPILFVGILAIWLKQKKAIV
jgi:hypothetical protein